MQFSTVGDVIFIHELAEPFQRIELQFCPDEVTWMRQGNWVNVMIPGRNNSRKHLTGGEDIVTMRFNFNGFYENNREHCIEKMTFLNSLVMTNGYVGPARNVKIAWANNRLFRHKVWVVKNVRSIMSDFHPQFNMNPMELFCDVEFELDPDQNPGINNVRLTGSEVRTINDSVVNQNVA